MFARGPDAGIDLSNFFGGDYVRSTSS